MTSGVSYQIQKIDDKVIMDRITCGNFGAARHQQVTLQAEELKRFRQYIQDKTVNCLTCDKLNLDFEEGYVECFRANNHCIELLTKNLHLLCHLFGNTFYMFGDDRLYKDIFLCTVCDKTFLTTNIKCMCCNRSLKRHHDRSADSRQRLKENRSNG